MKLLRLLSLALSLTWFAACVSTPTISFFITEQKFELGDTITIEQVRATTPALGAGDLLIVSGTYNLRSRREAKLSLSIRTSSPAMTRITDEQQALLKAGSGKFEVSRYIEATGIPHLDLSDPESRERLGRISFRLK